MRNLGLSINLQQIRGDSNKIENQNGVYFLTLTIIDLFTSKEFCIVVVDSLNYCITEKHLEVFAYVIMGSHIHCVCKVNEPGNLSYVIRDFMKFTSK
jgi:hypothetical protein